MIKTNTNQFLMHQGVISLGAVFGYKVNHSRENFILQMIGEFLDSTGLRTCQGQSWDSMTVLDMMRKCQGIFFNSMFYTRWFDWT